MHVTGVLLAAGSSSRFGEQKLLYELDQGKPLIHCSAHILKKELPDCVAVVANSHDEIARILEEYGFKLVVNPNADLGIGSSIHHAINFSNADAWVIALADMPFIQPKTIQKVVSLLRSEHKIVAPTYNKQQGHPVGFHSVFKNQLLELNGDHGAKSIIQRNISLLKTFETNDAGVIHDIDTKQDLKHFSSTFS